MDPDSLIYRLFLKLRPDIKDLIGVAHGAAVVNLFTFVYAVPLALGGLVWLVFRTDLGVVQQDWAVLLLLVVFGFLFLRYPFEKI